MSRYNTNLAAEFWVLSSLHRLGFPASLTLGNRKSVDILVEGPQGDYATIDVKGVAGRHDWPADNIRQKDSSRHFYAFVSFEGQIGDPSRSPEIWIVPSFAVTGFIKDYRTRSVVSRAKSRSEGGEYYRAWRLIKGSGEDDL